jgi:hypothetical protein
MSYQTIPEHSFAGAKPHKYGLMICIALLSVCTILICIYLVQRQSSLVDSDTTADIKESETIEAEAQNEGNDSTVPEIDFTALASNSSLAPAPSLALQEETSASVSSPQINSSQGSTPQAFLNNLQVSAVTNNKAVINGIVYHQGDYINSEQTIQLHSIQNDVLYFKSKDKSFAYRVKQ